LGVDYTAGTGTVARLVLPSLELVRDVVPGGVSGDPVLRAEGGRVLIVNRFGADNLTVIDPGGLGVIAQFSTGAGTNPQDVASKGDALFVPVFGRAAVERWRLRLPVERLEDVDTSALDPDGNPNAASAAVVGSLVYVTLGILDDDDPFLSPRGPGGVLVLDEAGETITTFELAHANPLGFLHRAGSQLVVATAPFFDASAGCIERISTGDAAGPAGCWVANADLGGYATALVPHERGLFVAVSAGFGVGRLVAVDEDGGVDPVALSGPDEIVTDAAFCEATGMIVYNDQSSGGLHVYDVTVGVRLTEQPLDLGLPSVFSNGIACF
jgi:hypothetical protein